MFGRPLGGGIAAALLMSFGLAACSSDGDSEALARRVAELESQLATTSTTTTAGVPASTTASTATPSTTTAAPTTTAPPTTTTKAELITHGATVSTWSAWPGFPHMMEFLAEWKSFRSNWVTIGSGTGRTLTCGMFDDTYLVRSSLGGLTMSDETVEAFVSMPTGAIRDNLNDGLIDAMQAMTLCADGYLIAADEPFQRADMLLYQVDSDLYAVIDDMMRAGLAFE